MSADTGPIRPEETFDEARVGDYLRRAIPALADAESLEFEQFHGGHANLTYLVRGNGFEFVLRRPPLGDVAPGSHDMGREWRVLSVLHTEFSPAPRAFSYCDDEAVMGKPFFVMERRHGTAIRGRWPSRFEESDTARRRVGEGLIDAAAALHGVDFESLGLGDLGRPDGFVGRQVTGWTDRWNRAKDRELPDMSALAAGLATRQPEPQRAALIHNDLKLDNTLVGDDLSIAAVLDWDMATLGDPLVDLGATLSYFEGPAEAAVIVPPDGTVLGGAITVDEILERYAATTGLDLSRIGWYRALGSFRIAVIIQQIYIRYVRGQTTDERFAVLGSVVPPIAAMGLRFLAADG